MPLPFDFESGGWDKWADGFPQPPFIGSQPAVYDGVAGGYATASTYSYWWDAVPYPGAYNADGLATRVVGYPSAYEEQNPPTLVAGTGIVVEWASITNDFQTGFQNSMLGTVWKYWPDEGMTPAEELPWVGPTKPGEGTETRVIPFQVEEFVVGWGTATDTGYDVVETTEDLHRQASKRTSSNTVVAVVGPQATPQPRARSRGRYTVHDNSLTRTRTKERKFIANVRARSILGIVAGAVTETVDGLTAVWKALPPQYRTGMKYVRATNVATYEVMTLTGWEWRTKDQMGADVLFWSGRKDSVYNIKGYRWRQNYYPKPQEMASDLWKHWDKVDVSEAVWNLASNEIEDRAYAKMSPSNTAGGRDWLIKTGRPVGFETGLAM